MAAVEEPAFLGTAEQSLFCADCAQPDDGAEDAEDVGAKDGDGATFDESNGNDDNASCGLR